MEDRKVKKTLAISEVHGATPLDEEVLQGLIPGLTTQRELDEFEAVNIARARLWAQGSRSLKRDLLSISGLKKLHNKMFEDTWEWAGSFRLKDTNIGVSPAKIQSDLAILLGDVLYWLQHQTFSKEEIAIRFHHRLVFIHPFPNGNGRFSRLTADLFLDQQGLPRFTWGKSYLDQNPQNARGRYIQALQKADREENYSDLLEFAKA